LRKGIQSVGVAPGAAVLCLLAVWLPAALQLGSGAWLMQSVWALWCAACGTALVIRLRAAGHADESAPDVAAERDIVHAIPLATCVCALPSGEILFANDAMVDLSGETREGLLGRELGGFCAQTQDAVRLAKVLQSGHRFDDVELPARRSDGSVRWLSVSGRPDVFDGRMALFVVCHDITGHKQAQRSLIASEERFRLLLGALSEAVVLYDAQSCVLTRNRAAQATSWLEAAHAGLRGGRADARLCDEQGRVLPPGLHPVMRSLADGQPLRDVVIGTDDAAGQMRWLAVTTQPLFHAGASRPYAVVASYSDLTARIRAERALRASEQRYALALRGMNEGLAEWLSGSNQLYVSARLSQIMGHDAGGRRMKVSDALQRIHPSDRAAWKATLYGVLRDKKGHFQQELRVMHGDGSYHWFRLRGAAQRESGRRGHRVVVTVADVSVSKRLEEVDGAERELLALIAASVPLPDVMSRLAVLVEQTLDEHSRVAVLVFDPAHPEQVDVAAPGLSAAFHASVAGVSGQLIERVLANVPRDLRPVLFDDREQIEGLVPLRDLMRAEAMHSLWVLPLVGQGNVLMGCLAIGHPHPWRPGRTEDSLVERLVDIAQLALERACAERQVRELHESLERRVAERTALLEQANNELEAFSYSVSHDLRSPLRAINGFAHLLAEHAAPVLDDQGRDMLERIQRGSTRMGQLIDDILHFSRMARVDMTRSDIELDSLTRAVAAELLEQYPAARITIAPLGSASGDQAMLRQVIFNLIGNALKFSAHAASPTVDVFVAPLDGEPAICVRDNGVGFDPKYADRLFGVFQRLHGASEFAGTGVGLAIVKRIVERHGGRVSVQAAPGKGATFRFTLDSFLPAQPQPGPEGASRTGTEA
jgi:PAS domain S-box-containing protein